MRIYANAALRWKGSKLYVDNKPTGFQIVPDLKHDAMWRVRRPDGSLTDMVNKVRAQDAARSLALQMLNTPSEGEGTGPGDALGDFGKQSAIGHRPPL